MVQEFHKAFDVLVPEQPIDRGEEHFAFRVELLNEEFNETIDAILEKNLTEVFDGIIDQIYICLGTISDYGDGALVTPTAGIFESTLFHYEVQLPDFPAMVYIDETRELVNTNTVYDCAHHLRIIRRNLIFLRRCGLYNVFMDGFKEVHRANMSKLGEDGRPILNEFGKITKGPNYTKPFLANIMYVL